MNKIQSILSDVRKETSSIILFSSITGKDSIILTHYCAQIFLRVICVYMYVVKGLQHIKKHQLYFENRFSNLEYLHVPHFCLGSYIKAGYMGITQDEKQKNYNLSQLNELIIEKTKIEWICFGMKQNDSLNRRLQLRGYEKNAINRINKKVYPLSEFTNKEVLGLIEINHLPRPIIRDNNRSQGESINDINYLLWLQENYPNDLLLTFETFPATRELIYKHEREIKTI
jgi:sulfate adenylyltransferase subunit 2